VIASESIHPAFHTFKDRAFVSIPKRMRGFVMSKERAGKGTSNGVDSSADL
jgi:hypothetical protein